MQRRRGLSLGNGYSFDQKHIARIQACIHLHDRDAAFRIAGFDRAMDRRGTAPARQKRSMNIQAAQAWRTQNPLRQDQTISGHDHHIGPGCLDLSARQRGFVRKSSIQPQATRLPHCYCLIQRKLLDRRGLQFQATPGWPVGLREDQGNFVAGSVQGRKRCTREFGRTRKNNFHVTPKR